MPSQISWQVNAYGLIGAVFVLSVWLMVLSAVIFAGVLFGALHVQRRAADTDTDCGDVDQSPLTLAGPDVGRRTRSCPPGVDPSVRSCSSM